MERTVIGWSAGGAKSVSSVQSKFLSATVYSTKCSVQKFYVLQAEYICVIWIPSDQVPCTEKIMIFATQPWFSRTLLFKGSQAWSVCLSAKSSSDDDDDYGALVKLYWWEKTEVLWEIPAPAHFVHHESHVLAWDRIQASAVRGQRS